MSADDDLAKPAESAQYASDPEFTGAGEQSKQSVYDQSEGRIGLGTIIKAMPYARCYEIQVFGAHTQGFLMSAGSSLDGGQGATEVGTLLPGVSVICFQSKSTSIFILGTLPQLVTNANLSYADFITRQTGVGVVEDIHNRELSRDYGIQNRSAGMPGDNVPGDWGSVNQVGGGVLVTQFMTMLKAGDTCGVWAFYFDQLLRVYGYNLEEFTSFTERVRFNDEGEAHDVEYGAKFPWEALGTNDPTDAFDDKKASWTADDMNGRNVRNPIEPKKEDQTGLWRHHTYRGFLGDLEQEYVTKAHPDYNDDPVSFADNAEGVTYSGLLHVVKGADGAYMVRSAKELIFIKYPLIPVPQQMAPPDHHDNGDWHTNYKASGTFGAGPDPKEQKAWDWGDEDKQPDIRSGSLLDYLAYKFNWYHVANFTEHKKDWRLPEEKDVVDAGAGFPERGTIDKVKILSLQKNFWADIPKDFEVDIDHRMAGVKYYEGMSCIAMLDDGTVMFEDAWGSQIIMSRGNITFAPAGDLICRPGRGMTVWSPGDLVLRSAKSVDITSSTKDVRIKAEGNMHILAGNGEDYGGILLESRADNSTQSYDDVVGTDVQSSGVVIKCKNSAFVTWATDIYLSVQKLDQKAAGIFYLDADDGNSNIIVKSKEFLEMLTSFHVINFADTSDAYYFGKDAAIIDAQICIVDGGAIMLDGPMIAQGFVGGGSFGHDGDEPLEVIPGTSGKIGDYISDAKDAIDAVGDNLTQRVSAIDDKARNDPDGLLNSAVVKKIGFSLRNDEQYGLQDDFKLRAARWQQYIEDDGNTWEEPAVTAPTGEPTFPHPGRKWTEAIYFDAVNLSNFDLGAGQAKTRANYDNKPTTSDPKAPSAAYKVLVDLS